MEYSGCRSCDFYDSEFGCTCSSLDLWYACPYEPDPTLSEIGNLVILCMAIFGLGLTIAWAILAWIDSL